jgi:5'-nucleotidase
MRALITNDDGVASVGIRTLALAAVEAGLEVTIAAPHTERSGASASLTALSEDGRLVVHPIEIPELPGVRVLGVEASPALIAFVAARGAFGSVPDILLSGINHGPNTGYAILHSGTVGAAFTASSHGIPSLAVSLATSKPTHFDTAAIVARRGIDWLIQNGKPGWVLNINVPEVAPEDLRGIKRAPLADFGAVQANIGEAGEGFVAVTFTEIDAERDSGTDAALLLDGWATATILQAPYENESVDISGLR